MNLSVRRERRNRGRSGLTVIEVIVVLLVVGFLFLVLITVLPRQRESARLAGCRNNLRGIGQALALYDQFGGALPFLVSLESAEGPGPCLLMLDTLDVPDFVALDRSEKAAKPTPGSLPRAGRVPGFLCLSDPNTASPLHPSPISYRACAGDSTIGANGAFAPGRLISMTEVEGGDGRAFTAAFSERLLGSGVDQRSAPSNHAVVEEPLGSRGCPQRPLEFWKGDAGSSWVEASWRSTLYNHAMVPNAWPSCVTEDGRAGFMGASSGHVEGVNVLILDGSVRTVRPTVALAIWKALATIGDRKTP